MENVTKINTVQSADTALISVNHELKYGLINGEVVYIDDVSNGLDCGCVCPHCDAKLVAKKGEVRTHHFAHYEGSDCGAGAETAIHVLAKQIIADRKSILLPTQRVSASRTETPTFTLAHQQDAVPVKLQHVEIEKTVGSYRPDLSATTFDGQVLDVEILVSHQVGDDKAIAAQISGRAMLEIDLSQLPKDSSPTEIEHAVLWQAPRHFVYSRWEAENQQQLQSKLEVIEAELDKPQVPLILEAPTKTHVMLLGYKIGSGYSKRYQSNFSVSHLFYVTPSQSNDTANFSLQSSGGFESHKVEVDPALESQLRKLNFPLPAILQRSMKPGVGRQAKWLVTAIDCS